MRVWNARRYYTFEQILRKYLRLRKPCNILEWGPGFSTKVMLEELPNSQIYSIEHDPKWANVWRFPLAHSNVHLHVVPLDGGYYTKPLEWPMRFDLVFVDGAEPRGKCLITARQVVAEGGLIILHDKNNYPTEINLFTVVDEDAHTVIMEAR